MVKAMGLTTASLYYHISSKQELLYKVLTTGIAPWVEQLEKINATDLDPMKKLRLAVENHLSFVLDNPNGVIVFQRERRFLGAPYKDNYLKQINRYDELFTEIIEAGMPGGVTGDPRLMRLAILGMINWTAEWYNPEGRLGADDIRRAFSEIVMDRILASDDPTK
ncbi:hypothetical protein ACFFX0_31060 [Citricoccus parietis]|uniref:HTH-type transcriptional repressor KstR2 C-terminal domain-containing protein n=1 Tax=Citricoccus parietis TaxID=592307 RepID=A0ABV5G8S6_9MICC